LEKVVIKSSEWMRLRSPGLGSVGRQSNRKKSWQPRGEESRPILFAQNRLMLMGYKKEMRAYQQALD
jgi:hypothetical protein